jgi:hypothetical protein
MKSSEGSPMHDATTSTNLIAELAEVVRLSEAATPGKVELHTSCSWRRIVADRGRPFLVPGIDPDGHPNMDTIDSAEFVVALVNWFRTHHATLTRIIESEATIRDVMCGLKDPANVHAMMLRGLIAVPTIRSMVHLRGEVPNGEDVQLARIAELQEHAATIRADYDALVIRLGEVTTRLEAADRYITAMHDAMNSEYDAAKQMHSKRQQEWVTAYSMLRRLKSAAAHMSDAAMHNSAREGLE